MWTSPLFRITIFTLLLPLPIWASGSWYSGDIRSYSARNTQVLVSEHVQRSIDHGLDWVILYGHHREGLFTGLQAILQEEALHTWRITPILGTTWAPSDTAQTALVLFGADPRTPVPDRSIANAIAWIESQRGVSISTSLSPSTSPTTAFLGIQNDTWSETCAPGGTWDRLLTSGYRIYLVGSSNRALESVQAFPKTYVWAEGNRPEQIITALRQGLAYVAQSDGIRLDLEVNGKPLGSVVPVTEDRVYIRLRGVSRHPISQITLIADGDSIWSVSPQTALFESRFFLPVEGRTYLRAILESEQGGYQTLGNPIFLVSESGLPLEEMPSEEALYLSSRTLDMTVDSALESLTGLEEPAQNRILSEYLRDPRMRYETVLALKHREDLILDRQLFDLFTHPDPEVRLGAACAWVFRTPVDLHDQLLQLLQDPAPQIRRYAARMLSQYTDGLQPGELLPIMAQTSQEERSYLLRSLAPTPFSTQLAHTLISSTQHPHPGISAAALDKLIEISNRNFKVIQALQDSALAGHVQAVEALGWIGDPRTNGMLEKIYLQEPFGSLKRASFLALEKIGAPYLNRKESGCPLLPTPPQIDGLLPPEEWASAATLTHFSDDLLGNPSPQQMVVHIARDTDHLYLSLSCDLPDSQASAAWIRLRDQDTSVLEDRVEWAISVGGDTPRIFSLTPTGAMLDQKDGNPDWNPTWQAAQVRTPDRWTLECALPFSELGIDPARPVPHFRFNLSWHYAQTPNHRWTWSVTYGAPQNPDRFGNLILMP